MEWGGLSPEHGAEGRGLEARWWRVGDWTKDDLGALFHPQWLSEVRNFLWALNVVSCSGGQRFGPD